MPELTERATIERLAGPLAWSTHYGIRWTAFKCEGYRLTAWWSDNAVAYHATLIDLATGGTRVWTLFDGDVGEWVLDRLREFGACLQIQDIETSTEESA